MNEHRTDARVSQLLERLEGFLAHERFGGVEVRAGEVHLFVVGGEREALTAGFLPPEPAPGELQPTVHNCAYSRSELLAEVRRLTSIAWDVESRGLGGVVSVAPKSDGSGLEAVCLQGTPVDALPAVAKYPIVVEWGKPPTTVGGV